MELLFKVYSGRGIRGTVLAHRHGADATLDYVLALMERRSPNIQIFNEGGQRVSLADLMVLLDDDEETAD